MYNLSYEASTLTELAITELSATEWRVSDRRIAEGNPAAVLGVIQRLGDVYEVIKLARPRERIFYSSFDRATASFVASGSPAAVPNGTVLP